MFTLYFNCSCLKETDPFIEVVNDIHLNQNQSSNNNYGNVVNTDVSNTMYNTSNTETNTNDDMDTNTNDNYFATNDTNQR